MLQVDNESLKRRLQIVQQEIARVKAEHISEVQKLDTVLSQNQRLQVCVDDDQLQIKMSQGYNKELIDLRESNDSKSKEIDVVNAERKVYKDKLTEATR